MEFVTIFCFTFVFLAMRHVESYLPGHGFFLHLLCRTQPHPQQTTINAVFSCEGGRTNFSGVVVLKILGLSCSKESDAWLRS